MVWEYCTGKLAVWTCVLRGRHTELLITAEDRSEVYIHCPFCRRRTHGWLLAPDRRLHGHRPGTMDVQRVVTHLPLSTLERLAALDRRSGDRRLRQRRTVHLPPSS